MCIEVSFSKRSLILAKLASMSSYEKKKKKKEGFKDGPARPPRRRPWDDEIDLIYLLLRSYVELLFLLRQSRRHVRIFTFQFLGLLPGGHQFLLFGQEMYDFLDVDVDRRDVRILRDPRFVSLVLQDDLLDDPIEK